MQSSPSHTGPSTVPTSVGHPRPRSASVECSPASVSTHALQWYSGPSGGTGPSAASPPHTLAQTGSLSRPRSGSLSALLPAPSLSHHYHASSHYLVTEEDWRRRFWGKKEPLSVTDGDGESGELMQSPHFPTEDVDAKVMLRDKGNASYLIILLLGAGFMFPFFGFTSAVDFMNDQYPSHPEVISNLATAYNLGGFVVYFLVLLYLGKFTIRSRILVCFSLEFILVALTPFWHVMIKDESTALWLVYTSLFVLGCISGTLNATVLGLAALFPSSYSQAALFGAGAAGTFITIIRVVTKLAIPSEKNLFFSSSVYFGLAAFIILCCVVCFLLLLRLDYAQYHLQREFTRAALPDDARVSAQQDEERGGLLGASHSSDPGEDQYLRNGADAASLPRKSSSVTKTLPSLRELGRMFRRCMPMFFSAFLTFFLSLALYPGVVVAIPEHSLGLDNGWWPLLLLSVWNVCDFIGRGLPNFFQLFSPKTIMLPVLSRFLVAPVLLFCVKPLLIESDALVLCLAIFFGLTNGYLGTLSMMYGSAAAEREEDLEATGILMSFGLNLGLVGGSTFSTLLVSLLDIHAT